jgi:isocitrate/isopropylmalate dehydrogenase
VTTDPAAGMHLISIGASGISNHAIGASTVELAGEFNAYQMRCILSGMAPVSAGASVDLVIAREADDCIFVGAQGTAKWRHGNTAASLHGRFTAHELRRVAQNLGAPMWVD